MNEVNEQLKFQNLNSFNYSKEMEEERCDNIEEMFRMFSKFTDLVHWTQIPKEVKEQGMETAIS